MNRTLLLTTTSLFLSGSSLGVAFISLRFSDRVNYLDYLLWFNLMAVTMLSLSLAALVISVIGTWLTSGKAISLWGANIVASFVVALYLFNQ